MKAINIGTKEVDTQNSEEIQQVMIDNDGNRQPCWYANFEFDGQDRDEAQWKVGVKQEEGSHEYSFKLTKAGDVENEIFWSIATSADFAIKLLALYRNGKQSVNEWVKSGCPIK